MLKKRVITGGHTPCGGWYGNLSGHH